MVLYNETWCKILWHYDAEWYSAYLSIQRVV